MGQPKWRYPMRKPDKNLLSRNFKLHICLSWYFRAWKLNRIRRHVVKELLLYIFSLSPSTTSPKEYLASSSPNFSRRSFPSLYNAQTCHFLGQNLKFLTIFNCFYLMWKGELSLYTFRSLVSLNLPQQNLVSLVSQPIVNSKHGSVSTPTIGP